MGCRNKGAGEESDDWLSADDACVEQVCSSRAVLWFEAAAVGSVRPPAVRVWLFVASAATSALKYAAVLLLLLAARPVFVFALRHFLLADLAHEVEEHLRDRGQVEDEAVIGQRR